FLNIRACRKYWLIAVSSLVSTWLRYWMIFLSPFIAALRCRSVPLPRRALKGPRDQITITDDWGGCCRSAAARRRGVLRARFVARSGGRGALVRALVLGQGVANVAEALAALRRDPVMAQHGLDRALSRSRRLADLAVGQAVANANIHRRAPGS